MTKARYYPPADRRTQDFTGSYHGSDMQTNVVVLHTTESLAWPDYQGGAVAPNLTYRPLIKDRKAAWRQHFPLDMSSRALVNASGGVETNTLNVAQLEMVGTCDPAHAKSWAKFKAGVDYIYYPDAPDWVLDDIAHFLLFMRNEWGVPFKAPGKWPAYPASINGARMSFKTWNNFNGVCGHMHVPENHHGDPGALDIHALLDRAQGLLHSPAPEKPATPAKPAAKHPRAAKVLKLAEEALPLNGPATKDEWQIIHDAAQRILNGGK
jgi:hypothetical protein